MIVVDVETSGTDPRKHSIVSIGALDFANPNNRFYEECHIWEGAAIHPDALAINGFSEVQIRDVKKPSVKEVMQRFMEWSSKIPDKTLAGHNITFDWNFLYDSARRSEILWTFGYRTIDLHTVAYTFLMKKGILPAGHGLSSISSEAIFLYAGLPPRKGVHNALEDAKLEVEALSRLIWGKVKMEEYYKYAMPDHCKE